MQVTGSPCRLDVTTALDSVANFCTMYDETFRTKIFNFETESRMETFQHGIIHKELTLRCIHIIRNMELTYTTFYVMIFWVGVIAQITLHIK